MSADDSTDTPGAAAAAQPASLKIFLNYRREDAQAEARLLYEHLAPRFGVENVFFDRVSLAPSVNWLKELEARDTASGVFIALIGARWIPSIADRTSAAVSQPVVDMVKREIELALSRGSGVRILPVLLDDAAMPSAGDLPRTIRGLADLQAVPLRQDSFDQDVARLVATIEQLPTLPVPEEPDWISRFAGIPAPAPTPERSVADLPDPRHYQQVLQNLIEDDELVVMLGSGVNTSYTEAGAEAGAPRLPDARELAAQLTRRFRLTDQLDDLAAVAQRIYVTTGKPGLYKTLRQLLPDDVPPSPVHRFLASLPDAIAKTGWPKRCQLIITTNYDTALEHAFDEVGEPYDLAVYMASGPHKGRFVHFPYEGAPQPVEVANDYGRFPIDDVGGLTRSVILKIHGAVDGRLGDYEWRQNYVITEDEYIDYLSRSPIESLIPVQILEKLTTSHWLFLGYAMRDWHLRVFLSRIWKGEQLGARSWAVERDPDEFEEEFWRKADVELLTCGMVDYLAGLARSLSAYEDER